MIYLYSIMISSFITNLKIALQPQNSIRLRLHTLTSNTTWTHLFYHILAFSVFQGNVNDTDLKYWSIFHILPYTWYLAQCFLNNYNDSAFDTQGPVIYTYYLITVVILWLESLLFSIYYHEHLRNNICQHARYFYVSSLFLYQISIAHAIYHQYILAKLYNTHISLVCSIINTSPNYLEK